MRMLIDTNVILDWLMRREPFHESARRVMEESIFGDIDGYISAHSLTDLFYILRKDFDTGRRKSLLMMLCERLNVISAVTDLSRKHIFGNTWNGFGTNRLALRLE